MCASTIRLWLAAALLALAPRAFAGDYASVNGLRMYYEVEGEGRPLALHELERIHRSKTGALIRASAVLGGMAAGAAASQLAALAAYGDAVGLAFQIADDVLDVTAPSDQLGKPAGRDLDLHKSTYPAVLGVANATERAGALVGHACTALREGGIDSTELDALARFVVERES